ncbi:MAG: desulfoferrodoxin [Clostridia bacterium]|nr:desulfoferrodoxin family protein [Lachnospiraceae bacterium]NCB99677.1 desulfoferrodoxin [Clostridia bacterium]NCD01750.1 desulfoferrodoxin [Clostridia bacterium]
MKFYECEHCGNIIQYAKDSGVPVMCCGQKMTEMVPGTSDGAVEKHLPVIKTEGQKVVVEVGSVAHPMVEAHYIEWIILETEKGYQKVDLKPEAAPKAEFILTDSDKVVAAYAYCNLHGLWKA